MKLLLASTLLFSTNGFTLNQQACRRTSTRLLAAGGAPQYEKFQATLRKAESVGNGSVMLRIETQDTVDYEPGHVLALEIQADDSSEDDIDQKTSDDAQANGGWMRGPYTVSRSTDKSLDILIKLVGLKSKRFASAEPGTALQFGGKFKVPILEGISAETTERVVLVSTGVGVGPCIGAIEKALELDDSFPPIDLIASYRTEEEVVYKNELDELQKLHKEKFSWKTIITSEQGRLSSDSNVEELSDTAFEAGIENTHYHLIGNGQMVSEFKAGLEKAGVPEDKVTLEMYFNHKAEMDTEAVERIAAAVMEPATALL